jgi:hypothetical protein
MLCLVKRYLVKKGSVRLCVVVMQPTVLLSPKFGPKSFSHSYEVEDFRATFCVLLYL